MQTVRRHGLGQIGIQPDQKPDPGLGRRLAKLPSGLDRIRRPEGAIDYGRTGGQPGRRLPWPGRAVGIGEEQQGRQGGGARADSGGGAV